MLSRGRGCERNPLGTYNDIVDDLMDWFFPFRVVSDTWHCDLCVWAIWLALLTQVDLINGAGRVSHDEAIASVYSRQASTSVTKGTMIRVHVWLTVFAWPAQRCL